MEGILKNENADQEAMKNRLNEWKKSKKKSKERCSIDANHSKLDRKEFSDENTISNILHKSAVIEKVEKKITPISLNSALQNKDPVLQTKNLATQKQPNVSFANESIASNSAAEFKKLMNRNKAYRMAHKIKQLRCKIASIDKEKMGLFVAMAENISVTISEIKSLIEIDEKLKFISFDTSPLYQQIQFSHTLLQALEESNLLNHVNSASKLLKIDGDLYFDSNQYQNLTPLLDTLQIEKIQLESLINHDKIDESLLINQKMLLESEIKFLSESISLLKMKINFFKKS